MAFAYLSLPFSVKIYLPADTPVLLLLWLWGIGVVLMKMTQPAKAPVFVSVTGYRWHEGWGKKPPCCYQISGQSRLLPFVLYLALVDESGKRHHRWVFPAECEPKIYRRLARLIIDVHHHRLSSI